MGWNLRRDGTLASRVGALVRRDRYFVEQASFFLSFLPALVLGRPDVVYFADLNLGNLCRHWQRVSGQRFKLRDCTGGLTTRPFTRAGALTHASARTRFGWDVLREDYMQLLSRVAEAA